jgi:hypothetical protein
LRSKNLRSAGGAHQRRAQARSFEQVTQRAPRQGKSTLWGVAEKRFAEQKPSERRGAGPEGGGEPGRLRKQAPLKKVTDTDMSAGDADPLITPSLKIGDRSASAIKRGHHPAGGQDGNEEVA